MEDRRRRETSTERLLYDDAAPRLRRPINPTVLKFRRPAALVIPLAIVIGTAVSSGTMIAVLVANEPGVLMLAGAVFGGFFLAGVLLALIVSRRSGGIYALFTPNLISVSHAVLLLAFVSAIAMPEVLQVPPAEALLGALPGPELPTPRLGLFKAYVVLFVLITAASIAAGVLVRLVCFRRVIAGEA